MSAKGKPARANAEETPELLDFAREFRDEIHLRQITAQLFENMHFSGVRITHGTTEKGKDIIFYTKGPLGELTLCACVIKNERITGNAASASGAATVLNQALQALREPYVNRSTGARERTSLVYVISPYNSAGTAIESIQAQLEDRAGQVVFKCGRDFFKLFVDYWPDFLRFESGVLTRYLTSLKGSIAEDRALTTLLARQGIASSERTIEDFYVQPELDAELAVFSLREPLGLTSSRLTRGMTLSELHALQSVLKQWSEALKLAEVWTPASDLIPEYVSAGQEASSVAIEIGKLWERRYRSYEQIRSQEQRAKVRKSDVRLELEADDDLRSRFERIVRRTTDAYEAFEDRARMTMQFCMSGISSCQDVLHNPQFVDYCRTEDLSLALPTLFKRTSVNSHLVFKAEVLDDVTTPLLITAPAGFGKSWFCKWHTLNDARAHVHDPNKPLPIYVRLYEHGQGKLDTFEETFLPTGEVRTLIEATPSDKHRNIRLYLDGLDEIPDMRRQAEIVAVARQGLARYPHLQIIITARDHVRGPWLGWLPRLQLAPFAKAQSAELTRKWFDEQGSIDKFERELQHTPSLANLMAVPLLATLIINLYRQTGTLPATKAKLYRLFVELLSGGWDAVKQTHRGGRYGPDTKILVLTFLAAQMHYSRKRDATERMFQSAIDSSLPAFSPSASTFLEEVLQDGLLVRSGALLLFTHLSFQEYLVGRALQANPNDRKARNAVTWFLQGNDWWKEPVAFYLGSSESPLEARHWLQDVMERAAERHGKGTDFTQRSQFLLQTLDDSFPGSLGAQ